SETELPHERTIDLDGVDGKRAQVAQRRIAGAEVVERDADADVAKLPQNGFCRIGVVQQRGLGDLELEAMRQNAGIIECLDDAKGEARALELRRRKIDRQ